jgi:hypothetical protein
LHVKFDDGAGAPQSAGHSHAQTFGALLHSELPGQPPQSAGQAYVHVERSHTALGPGAGPPQSDGQT